MFGKPEWFKTKRVGWGLTPVSWQGWCYAAGWFAVIALPFLLLLLQGLVVESVVWMAAAIATVVWDVKSIMRSMASHGEDDVLYIDDDEPTANEFASKKFNFRLRG